MLYWDEYNQKYTNLMSYGSVLLAKHERSFAINHEEGYITSTYSNPEDDDRFQCWSTDVKHFCQRELPHRLFESIPRNRLEIGTVIQHDFLTLPRGTLIHDASNLIILPSTLPSAHLPSPFIPEDDETKDFLLKISLVEAISRDRFPQYLIASSVYWHCLHLKDRCQKISRTM
uniref:HNH nuclease domain-containing protein n=1 Tax=Panagrolaimus sp. ES5 TaxID=591445 RepID=A0AC34G7E9_9BILA